MGKKKWLHRENFMEFYHFRGKGWFGWRTMLISEKWEVNLLKPGHYVRGGRGSNWHEGTGRLVMCVCERERERKREREWERERESREVVSVETMREREGSFDNWYQMNGGCGGDKGISYCEFCIIGECWQLFSSFYLMNIYLKFNILPLLAGLCIIQECW